MSKTVVIFGAGGATGLELVRQAKARGHQVRAVEHERPFDAADGDAVVHYELDVMKDDLTEVMQGAYAVISALGLDAGLKTILNPPPLYTEGTQKIVSAMEECGVTRLVVISASFVETLKRGPIWFRAAALVGLSSVVSEMKQMEWFLRGKQTIDWTAVRPGWLLDAPMTGDYVVAEDVIPRDLIRTRHGDLAHFMLDCVEEGSWLRQTPAIARAEPARVSGPDAVLREMMG
ncbi:NAD(P)-dependent oxidoreductase [Aestuariibius sp. 2305UL40-4]|uniref:NAD(P)-dependent oxidoreductase n=1 Tax=Aestuariibius violaceus TaxID=3234132 RepID=UPI00345EEF53